MPNARYVLTAAAVVLAPLLAFMRPAPAADPAPTSRPSAAVNTNWPMWRGPHGDGRSDETDVPTKWSASENVTWKVPIPGKGHSSPVVWGDRIFVTTAVEPENKRDLLCLDRRDGKVLWRKTVLTAPLEKKHNLNSFA